MRAIALCTAKKYEITSLARYFKQKGGHTKLARTMLHVRLNAKDQDLFFFSNGCLITWNVHKKKIPELIHEVMPFTVEPLAKIETDQFIVVFGKKTKIYSHDYFSAELISLESTDSDIKLAISYGLASSVKLEYFEELIQQTIAKNTPLIENLSKHGKITLRSRELIRRMGDILLERNALLLISELQDVPDFFWDNPNLEDYFKMIRQFLDIPTRIETLNQKLDVLHSTLDLLNSLLQNNHSTLLEYIIIILIMMEVIFSVIHLF